MQSRDEVKRIAAILKEAPVDQPDRDIDCFYIYPTSFRNGRIKNKEQIKSEAQSVLATGQFL